MPAPLFAHDSHRCAHTDPDGFRCANPGSLSSSTYGADHWYCADHFAPLRQRGPRTPPPNGFDALRASLNTPQHPHDWAHRILARHAAGETLPALALAYATETLAQKPPR